MGFVEKKQSKPLNLFMNNGCPFPKKPLGFSLNLHVRYVFFSSRSNKTQIKKNKINSKSVGIRSAEETPIKLEGENWIFFFRFRFLNFS